MNSVSKAWADLPPIFADRLMALVTAPQRLWHGLHWTNALLLDADRFCAPHWLRPLRWAILYRYAVFDPCAPDEANAAASAELWSEHFPAIHETVRNVSGQWERDVARAILADPFDRPADLLPWQEALLDLELGVLGASAPLYEAARLCQAEEFSVSGGAAADWIAKRRLLTERALAAPQLFRVIHPDRETQARSNLSAELALLARG